GEPGGVAERAAPRATRSERAPERERADEAPFPASADVRLAVTIEVGELQRAPCGGCGAEPGIVCDRSAPDRGRSETRRSIRKCGANRPGVAPTDVVPTVPVDVGKLDRGPAAVFGPSRCRGEIAGPKADVHEIIARADGTGDSIFAPAAHVGDAVAVEI